MVEPAVVRHFSRAAASYSRLRGAGPLSRMRSREQAAVQELVQVDPGATVLDAGCGDGATLEWLHERGALALGIDLTLPMARLCLSRGYSAVVQDLEDLGLRPVFDWILCIGALEFVPDPARALKNLAECLAPRGTLVLLYPRKGPLGTLYALYHRTHGARIHLFDSDEIISLLRGAGLAPPTERRDCALSSVCSTLRVGEEQR
jgi:2-polyprenyl-3-methyl-5-hydroxy-6-metoxy-1,4-benzoquinol methylase